MHLYAGLAHGPAVGQLLRCSSPGTLSDLHLARQCQKSLHSEPSQLLPTDQYELDNPVHGKPADTCAATCHPAMPFLQHLPPSSRSAVRAASIYTHAICDAVNVELMHVQHC